MLETWGDCTPLSISLPLAGRVGVGGKVTGVEERTSRLALSRDYFLESVDAVPPDGWKKATLCEGWTPVHVVAHVATGDQLTRGIVFDGIGRSRAGQDLPVDFADRKRRFEQSLSVEPEKLKKLAHAEAEQTVSAIIDAVEKAPQTVVTMPYGPVPITGVRALRLNEYIIHGHDLTPAIGRSIPIPNWFIDRALGDAIGLMTRLHLRSPRKGQSASFHFHRSDGEGEWTLRAEGGQAVVESGHGKADVAFRGTGEDLYWVLMGRAQPGDNGIEVHGSPALAAAFKEWFPGP